MPNKSSGAERMWRRLDIPETNSVKWNTNVRNLNGSQRKTAEKVTNMRGESKRKRRMTQEPQ